MATGGEDGVTRLWDTSTGTMTAQCRGHTRKVLQRRVSPGWPAPRDGLGGWDRAPMGFHDGPGGRVALRSSHRGSHDGDSTAPTVCGSPPEARTGRSGCGTRRTGRTSIVLQGHTGDVRDLAFTADGRRLASASQLPTLGHLEQQDGTVRLWEIGRHGAGVRVARPHQLRLSSGV